MITVDADVTQGFNFDKNKQVPAGFVTAMKIADTAFTPDMEITDIGTEQPKKVVGVLRFFEWDTSITGPQTFEMQVSVKGKQEIKQLLLKDLTKVNVEITYVLYDFDSDSTAQVFYQNAHTNDAPLKGVVQKQGEAFVLNVKDVASPEVSQPENYLVTLGFTAQGKQDMHLATSSSAKFVKQVGMDA